MNPSSENRPASFRFSGYEIERESGTLTFRYDFGSEARFAERIDFGKPLPDLSESDERAFKTAVRLAYAMCGISYYKLYAPSELDLGGLPFATGEIAFLRATYEEGLGEFAYRNGLDLRGRINFTNYRPAGDHGDDSEASILDPEGSAVLIGGGKDSLVSLEAMAASGADFTLFAVNPRTPMIDCAKIAGRPLASVKRVIDPLLFDYNGRPGVYNGHIPITAIVSLTAVIGAFFHGYANIVLSNERSADEPTLTEGDRAVNHQYSKSSAFEAQFTAMLRRHVSPRLAYFSLLRPLSEVHIARLFARTERYDHAFTSCNKAFRLNDRPDSLWCGDCAKCRFTFLLLALFVPRQRLLDIFPRDLLDDVSQVEGYRELTGLGRHKPWDCVGEELEAATAIARLAGRQEWRDKAVIRELAPHFTGEPERVEAAYEAFLTPSEGGVMPDRFRAIIDAYAG